MAIAERALKKKFESWADSIPGTGVDRKKNICKLLCFVAGNNTICNPETI